MYFDSMNNKDFICTYSGKKFYPLDPKEEDIYIEDIAHALSLICRFSGHCRTLYSVGQHSLMCMDLSNNEDKLAGLLHDSAESFIQDISTPLKKHFPYYHLVENNIMTVIAKKWNFVWPLSKEVKDADLLSLAIEKEALMDTAEEWEGVPKDPNPEKHHITFERPEQIEEMFLWNFNELKLKRYDNLQHILYTV